MRLSVRISLVVLSVITCCFSLSFRTVNAQTQVQAGQVLISELRLRGPAGAEDEFIEIYNNTDQAITVQALDSSSGWSVVISNGQITGPICVIPNGVIIPARGHFLCGNTNGYSLSAYPSGNPSQGPALDALAPAAISAFASTTPDRTWDFDVPDGSGVALFATTNGTNLTAATRLDAFGFTSSPALYREGTGFATIVTANIEHTYYRDLKTFTPKDTNNNAADFRLVGTAISLQISLLGAPGPENLNSPTQSNNIPGTLIDPAVPASQPPNRERRPTVEPNADLGTLLIRRTLTNNTGLPVSRLRFRVVDITTLGTPPSECAGCADVRALTSFDCESASGGQVVTVRGLRLEDPPSQPAGGGLNATVSADSITLASPLQPGESVNVEFKLGVMRTGSFRFYVAIEAQNGSQLIVTKPGRGWTVRRGNLRGLVPRSGLGGEGQSDTLEPRLLPVDTQAMRETQSPSSPATRLTVSTGQPLILRSWGRPQPARKKKLVKGKRVSVRNRAKS